MNKLILFTVISLTLTASNSCFAVPSVNHPICASCIVRSSIPIEKNPHIVWKDPGQSKHYPVSIILNRDPVPVQFILNRDPVTAPVIVNHDPVPVPVIFNRDPHPLPVIVNRDPKPVPFIMSHDPIPAPSLPTLINLGGIGISNGLYQASAITTY